MVSLLEIWFSMIYQKTLKFVSAALVAMLLPMVALAQVTPLIMERAPIRIEAPAVSKEKPGHPPINYDIEVRPEDAMKLEYIHTLNTLGDANGVMIAFTAPSMVALPMMKVYQPVDALFVADNGSIVQILPNVTLGEMAQEVMAHAPVKAFVFLKAGQVAARGIRPRDVIMGSMFTPDPPVLQ